jgi:hypothetical protein
MAKRDTPSFDRSASPGTAGAANRVADFVKSTEEEVKRLLLAGHALTRPGHFDPQEAMRVKLEFDGLFLNLQRAKQAAETEYFAWLEANIPELFSNKGRPDWIESEKVIRRDRALLKDFEHTLARNMAANAGKKHGASQKTYSDLADKYGDNDEETTKRRVMRGRRRQKALNETIQDIQDILRSAAPGGTDRPKVTTPKEYERRREKLLQAFRRVLKVK